MMLLGTHSAQYSGGEQYVIQSVLMEPPFVYYSLLISSLLLLLLLHSMEYTIL